MVALEVGGDDGGAALGELVGDRLADAARGAGDDRDLAFEVVVHSRLPVRPPSITIGWPLVHVAPSEAAKATASDTSSTVPMRVCFIAARSPKGAPATASKPGIRRSTIAVSTNAGQMVTTRTPASRSSIAATSTHPHHAALGGAVAAEQRRAAEPGDAGHVDDHALGGGEVRRGVLDAVEDADDVDVEDQPDLVGLVLDQRLADLDAGVVDDDVEAAEALGRRAEAALRSTAASVTSTCSP